MKKIINKIALLTFIIYLSIPLTIINFKNLDIFELLIDIVLILGTVYSLFNLWNNYQLFVSNIEYVIHDNDKVEKKYNCLINLLKQYLNIN